MADAKHTAGPWNVRPELPGEAPDYRLVGANIGSDGEARDGATLNGGIWVAKVQGPDCVANAQLIRAAPDLLEALSLLSTLICQTFPDLAETSPLKEARAAVARATGEG